MSSARIVSDRRFAAAHARAIPIIVHQTLRANLPISFTCSGVSAVPGLATMFAHAVLIRHDQIKITFDQNCESRGGGFHREVRCSP